MRPSYAITKKSQITLPAEVRKALGIKSSSRVSLTVDKEKKTIHIKPISDILDLAGTIVSKKPFNPSKIREYFEKHYERR